MKKYALLFGLGVVPLVTHAQVSGKTTTLDPTDYDSPADTNRVRSAPGAARSDFLRLPHLADPADGEEPLGTDNLTWAVEPEPDEVFWTDDVAATPDSASPDAADRILPTGWQISDGNELPWSDEQGTSGDAAPQIDENAHLGEPWQYVGWRERQFLHIRFVYIDWLAQINGTGPAAEAEPEQPAPAEAEDWTTVGLEESAFLVIGKTSDVPDALSERQDYLAGWEWYFREEDGPEESGTAFGNTAVVAQGWRTFADEAGLLRLPGVTIVQRGDDQFAQVSQRESGSVARVSQDGEANTAHLTQTAGDSSVEVTQLGTNHTVTTDQATTGSFAVVEQLGTGQTLRLEQAPDPEGRGRLNRAALVQAGSGNDFNGTQTGSENRLAGLEGTLSAEQTGLGNRTRLEQDGDENVLLIRQEGENQRATVLQAGDKNRAVISQSRVP